jgi:hypothetical protein
VEGTVRQMIHNIRLYELFMRFPRLSHTLLRSLKLTTRMDADPNPGHSVTGDLIFESFLRESLLRLPSGFARNSVIRTQYARHAS